MSDTKNTTKRFVVPGDYEGRLIGDNLTGKGHIAYSEEEAKSLVELLNELHEAKSNG